MPNQTAVYVANESFVATIDGLDVVVTAGVTRVHEGHPLLAARGDSFEPVETGRGVEQATAAPGETRP